MRAAGPPSTGNSPTVFLASTWRAGFAMSSIPGRTWHRAFSSRPSGRRGGRIEIDGRVPFPHSLGIFYEAMTQHLGFPHYGDEYKVMGLAPYGEPGYADVMRRVIRPQGDVFELDLDYFTHHKQ